MRIVSFRRKMYLLCIGATLLLFAAGCSGTVNNMEPADPSSGMAGSSPPTAPTESPSATPTVPSTATPDPASSKPPADQSTGLVTAVRLADPMAGWTGGDGWIAHTNDGGKSWQVQYRGEGRVMQIFALNGSKAWASLGTDGGETLKLIRTTDGGAHWADAGTVPGGAFFHFTSDSEAFSGNARTTDGGKTWSKLNSPDGIVGNAYYHDAMNGWAVTEAEGGFAVRRTTDGGKIWSVVLEKTSEVPPQDAIVRSAGKNDAWVELIGDSGMTQTSYSLLHTADGGKSWQSVLANSSAGSGPAPGFAMDEDNVPRNNGNSPGMLYVVDQKVAFMGGQCQACDNPNTIGKTIDGGKSWVNLAGEYPGYGSQLIAAADAEHVWWINTDSAEPSKMYVTSDGGKSWKLVHSFDKPSA